MPLPTLLAHFQCTSASCSRLSTPINILTLLPSLADLQAQSSSPANPTPTNPTTQVPFTTMLLTSSASQLCPFCRSPSRLIPVDPTFQASNLRSALRVMFGGFFGNFGPDVIETRMAEWMPPELDAREGMVDEGFEGSRTGAIQWIMNDGEVFQLRLPARRHEHEQISESQVWRDTEFVEAAPIFPVGPRPIYQAPDLPQAQIFAPSNASIPNDRGAQPRPQTWSQVIQGHTLNPANEEKGESDSDEDSGSETLEPWPSELPLRA